MIVSAEPRSRGSNLATWVLASCILAALPAALRADEGEPAERRFGVSSMMYGGGVGRPLGLSGSAGIIIGTVPVQPVKGGVSSSSIGAILQVEPGTGGGKVSLGLANSDGVFGYALKGSLVRTWGLTWGTQAGATYLGPELESATIAKVTVGWLWKTGHTQGKDSLFTWGIGFGF